MFWLCFKIHSSPDVGPDPLFGQVSLSRRFVCERLVLAARVVLLVCDVYCIGVKYDHAGKGGGGGLHVHVCMFVCFFGEIVCGQFDG